MNDTLTTLISQGVEIGSQFTSSQNLIPGVNNNLLGSFITILAGIIIRAVEKRRILKNERKRRAGEE